MTNTGACSNCDKRDKIEPEAKYCRYCGAELILRELPKEI